MRHGEVRSSTDLETVDLASSLDEEGPLGSRNVAISSPLIFATPQNEQILLVLIPVFF